MDCLFERDQKGVLVKVLAPKNKMPSLLFEQIRKSIPDDYVPDDFVRAAFKEGKIRSLTNRDEIALALWAKVHTPFEKLEIGSQPSALSRQQSEEGSRAEVSDLNGEPIFPMVRQKLGLDAEVPKKISLAALIGFFKGEKLIRKEGSQYVVSKESTLQYEGKPPAEQNAKRIAFMLERFGLPKGAVKLRKKGEETVVEFDEDKMRVGSQESGVGSQTAGDSQPSEIGGQPTNTKLLVRFLKERFPQLEIGFVTEEKARRIYNQLRLMQPANRRFQIDFDQVKSFVYQGKVHLIEGRVNDHDVIVEEVLHPFVYTVSKENPGLFKNLLEAAKKDFGDVHKRINELYTDKAGFTEDDREQELVAQVLSQLFLKEHTSRPPVSIRSLLQQFVEWFARLVKDLGAFLGGKNQVVINAAKMGEGINLTDIARMLNTFDSQFLVDTTSPAINFRLSQQQTAFYEKVLKKANALQKEVIKDVQKPKEPVIIIEEDHVYLNTKNGRRYTSTTTAINGTFKDTEGKYELNRLFGNALDHVLESLVLGLEYKDLDKDKMKVLDEKIAEAAYRELRSFLQGVTRDGTIALPQVLVSEGGAEVAGMIDLLLIHPDGTMTVVDLKTSKTSVRDKSYTNFKSVGEGSWLEGEPLSKSQKHGIQIGTYKRMLEVAGHTVVGTQTYHIYLDIEGEGDKQKVKRFEMEDFVTHAPSEYEELVRRIIKAEPVEDKLDKFRRELGLVSNVDNGNVNERQKGTRRYRDQLEELRVKVEGFRDQLVKRLDRLDKVKSIANFKPAKEAKQKLSELLMFMNGELSRKRADLAYGRFLNHAFEELSVLNAYLEDPANKATPEYIERVLDVDSYLETYRGMANAKKWALGNRDQERMLGKVQDLLDDTQKVVRTALADYILHVVRTTSSKDLTEEEWRAIIKEAVDISKLDLHLGDIDTSTDTLVAVAAKIYKISKLKGMARSEKFKEKLRLMGERLAKAFNGAPDFKMMLDFDENGKFTGRYIQKIGLPFRKMYMERKSQVMDKDGRMLKYRPVYSPNAKPEDIAYNKSLYKKRQEWYKFKQAEDTENLTPEGKPSEGMYYRYKKEYTDDRDKYEEFKDGRWVMRAGVNKDDFMRYELKYYTTLEGYDSPYIKDGEFTGIMLQRGGRARFVKDEFVELRDIAADGTELRSDRYMKLMTGTDERTAAMREFYKFYVENMEYCRDLLPPSVGRDMLGKVGRVRGKFIDYAKKYTPAFFKAAAKSAGELFQVRVSTRQAMYDEDGNPVNQIPIFYTGGLRNQQKIDELEKQLEELEKEWKAKKMSKADYMAKEKVLKKELDQALNALDAEEIEMDMVKNLGAFYDMTVSFDEMQRIEGVMQAVLRQLYDRYYTRMTATGNLEMDAKGNVVRRKGDDSRTAERFDAWMQMTFYSSQELDRNTFEVVAKKLMTLSSTTNIGFNGFGPIHNYVEARINLAIEAWGGSFFNRAAVRRASNAFRNEFLPGFVRTFNAMEGFYYKKKRMGSKYEALAKKFNMVRHTRLGEGKHKKSALDYVTYGFWGQDAGEFVAQTISGMSYIDSYQIEGADGTKMSIYDAYEFDEASQTLTIKPGFEDFEKNEVLQHTITNTIWEINKQLNGNHSWEDRAMIQKEVLGMMAMQFHKWVYPAYKARFQRAYVDENRGKIEGRYITLYNMLLLFKDAEGNFIKRINSAWHGLEPHQIKNMYRNMAELSYFSMCFAAYTLLKMVAENVDDDDKLKKRLVNFLAWEASRNQKGILFWWPGLGAKEQFEMIKNPFAAGTTVTQFADVIGAMGNLVMPPYNDDYFNKMYYDRGPFKGQLKLWKETKDLIPVLKELNRWSTFDNVTSFHIK